MTNWIWRGIIRLKKREQPETERIGVIMNKGIVELFGFGGTGFLPLKSLKKYDYHGKARVYILNNVKLYRPQSLFFDMVHILSTRSLMVFESKVINIK